MKIKKKTKKAIKRNFKASFITILVILGTFTGYASITTLNGGDLLDNAFINSITSLVNTNETKLTNVTDNGAGSGITINGTVSTDIPTLNTHSATKEYVDNTVGAAGGVECGAFTLGSRCSRTTIYAGYLNGTHYMTTPGACDNSTTPFCNGSIDTLIKSWGANTILVGVKSDSDGQGNTTTLATSIYAAAAKYCNDMIYGGYSDWFLPSKDELNILYINRNSIGGFRLNSYSYWSSTERGISTSYNQDFSDGFQNIIDKHSLNLVRCIRKI